ncbi:MAG TPA: arylesterase [Bryobacteraceae bacterium]|nr:arylesterase [Bryobacteraceae bacterium]
MHRLPFILTLLAAAGCTREQTAPAATNSAAPPPLAEPAPASAPQAARTAAVEERPIIVAFGDSLSEGTGVGFGQSFPDVLQQKLDAAGYKYRVINMGIGGDTTTGGLARVHTVAALKPEIVLLELGGNDGLRGVPVAATKANLEKIVEELQGAGVGRIMLAGMSLPPNYGTAYIRAFENIYRDVAAKYKLALIPFLFEDIAKDLAAKPGLMQRDGIHPSAAGHRIMAGTVFRYLKPVLRRS